MLHTLSTLEDVQKMYDWFEDMRNTQYAIKTWEASLPPLDHECILNERRSASQSPREACLPLDPVKGKKGMRNRQKKQGKGVQTVLAVPGIATQQYKFFKSMLQFATYLQHIFR